jgi:hypothetical protein
MAQVTLVVCAAVFASMLPFARGVTAQETGRRTEEQMKASFESHEGDFDYLLGDWEFTATSQQYGRFRGSGARCAWTRDRCSTSTGWSATAARPIT